jgi:branched-chain amino acid transport system permease protein
MQKSSGSFSDMLRVTLRDNLIPLVVIAFLLLFPYIVAWITGDSPLGVGGRPRGQSVYWQSIFIEVFVFAILAMSYNLMFGFTGVISFGHALFFGLGGYSLGIMLEKVGFVPALSQAVQPLTDWMIVSFGLTDVFDLGVHLSLGISIVIALALAGLVGLFMGFVSLRLKGVYFAIFTLALTEMAFIYVGRWRFTNSEDGFPITFIPEYLNPTKSRLTAYYIALVLTVLVFLIIRRIMNSPTGRVLLAIRENEDRAQSIGYDTLRFKLLAITVASMMASMAGIVHVLLNKKVGPEIMGVQFTIEPLLMTIIGGIGTHGGPVIGATLLHLGERILNREFIIGDFVLNIGQYWSLGLGISFILVVLIFPQGILGSINKWRLQRQLRATSQPERPHPPGD